MAKSKKAKKKSPKKKKVSTKTKTKKMEQQEQEQPEERERCYESFCGGCNSENLLLLNLTQDFTEGVLYIYLICADCELTQRIVIEQ